MNWKQNKPGKKEIAVLVLIAGSLAFIWGHSLIPATGSARESMAIVVLINEFLSKIDAPVRMQGDKILRKIAHAAEYTVLGLEFGALAFIRKKDKRMRWGLSRGVWISLVDETIQLFVPGRYGQISDVWIDCGGFVAGLLIAELISLIRKKKREE